MWQRLDERGCDASGEDHAARNQQNLTRGFTSLETIQSGECSEEVRGDQQQGLVNPRQRRRQERKRDPESEQKTVEIGASAAYCRGRGGDCKQREINERGDGDDC